MLRQFVTQQCTTTSRYDQLHLFLKFINKPSACSAQSLQIQYTSQDLQFRNYGFFFHLWFLFLLFVQVAVATQSGFRMNVKSHGTDTATTRRDPCARFSQSYGNCSNRFLVDVNQCSHDIVGKQKSFQERLLMECQGYIKKMYSAVPGFLSLINEIF